MAPAQGWHAQVEKWYKFFLLPSLRPWAVWAIHLHASKYSVMYNGFLSGIIRQNWNDTEKISMAPAQGWHAQVEDWYKFFLLSWSGCALACWLCLLLSVLCWRLGQCATSLTICWLHLHMPLPSIINFRLARADQENSAFCVAAGFGGVGVPAPGGAKNHSRLLLLLPRAFLVWPARGRTQLLLDSWGRHAVQMSCVKQRHFALQIMMDSSGDHPSKLERYRED